MKRHGKRREEIVIRPAFRVGDKVRMGNGQSGLIREIMVGNPAYLIDDQWWQEEELLDRIQIYLMRSRNPPPTRTRIRKRRQ